MASRSRPLAVRAAPLPWLAALALLGTVAAADLSGASSATGAAPPRGAGSIVPVTAADILALVRRGERRAVLVNIWATWCQPCVAELPDLLAIRRDYRERGFELLLVSADFDSELPQVQAFLDRQGVDFPTYFKNEKDQAFITGLSNEWSGALPASFLYGPDGKLRQFWQGQTTPAILEQEIVELLKANRGAVPEGSSQMVHRIGAVLAAFSLLAGMAVVVGAEGSLAIGATAPKTAVKMKNIDGRELSIADVAGPKGTLVMFSCNACPWVKAWEDRIAAIGNSYQQKGVGVIVINPNDPAVQAEDSYAVMQERAKQRGFEFPYVVDATSDVARAYGATRTPEAFLFDAGGKLVYHGAIDDNAKQPEAVEEHYLKDALEALIGGQTIAVRETKSIGCTIKFRS